MKVALLLAAGLGARMRPLSVRIPKPVLRANHEILLHRHLRKLEKSGHSLVMVTCSYQSQALRLLASRWRANNMRVEFSHEGPCPLETAGGIRRAIARCGDRPVTLVNGDVWTSFEYDKLAEPPPQGVHLLLADNPSHHPEGDFTLSDSGMVGRRVHQHGSLTYTGIARLDPTFLAHTSSAPKLGQLLHELVDRQSVTGQHAKQPWFDIGSPAALASFNAQSDIQIG